MQHKRVRIVLAILLALFSLRIAFVTTFWRWNDQDAIFEEHIEMLGWPEDLISLGGGYGTTGILGYRAHRILADRDDLERTFELEVVQSTPLTGWKLVRASAPL